MNDASCTHPKVRYGDNLFTSPTPVSWACLDCGARGMAEIVEYLAQDAPTPQPTPLGPKLSAIGFELSALGPEISAISSEPLADMSPQLVSLSHRVMAQGLNLVAFGLWLRA